MHFALAVWVNVPPCHGPSNNSDLCVTRKKQEQRAYRQDRQSSDDACTPVWQTCVLFFCFLPVTIGQAPFQNPAESPCPPTNTCTRPRVEPHEFQAAARSRAIGRGGSVSRRRAMARDRFSGKWQNQLLDRIASLSICPWPSRLTSVCLHPTVHVYRAGPIRFTFLPSSLCILFLSFHTFTNTHAHTSQHVQLSSTC